MDFIRKFAAKIDKQLHIQCMKYREFLELIFDVIIRFNFWSIMSIFATVSIRPINLTRFDSNSIK